MDKLTSSSPTQLTDPAHRHSGRWGLCALPHCLWCLCRRCVLARCGRCERNPPRPLAVVSVPPTAQRAALQHLRHRCRNGCGVGAANRVARGATALAQPTSYHSWPATTAPSPAPPRTATQTTASTASETCTARPHCACACASHSRAAALLLLAHLPAPLRHAHSPRFGPNSSGDMPTTWLA